MKTKKKKTNDILLKKSLEDEDLIASTWRVAPETNRRRKYYRLTLKGERALESERQQWLCVDAVLAKLWNLEPRIALG